MSFWVGVILTCIYFAVVITSVAVVISENRNPIRALAWVIALLFLPFVGLVFYLFFGRGLRGMAMISRRNKRKLMHYSHLQTLPSATAPDSQHRQLIRLAHNLSNAPLSFNNTIKVYTSGFEKFADLKRDLLAARKSILLQYYIFSDDDLGSEIAQILIDKVRQGVDVYVMYDHVGSFSTSNSFFKQLSDAGAKVHPFFKVTFPQLANRINWRNHRKIVIIDDKTGYIGGMNIADRYVKGQTDGSNWRDTHFRVTGDIIQSIFYSFAIDWNFLNPKLGGNYNFDPPASVHTGVGMQFVASGPADHYHSLSLCFLQAISTARKRIYIQTPYFLPTDALMNALEAAALAKLDVRIMIPRTSDSPMLKYASYSYITQCLKSGIKIYLYNPGMLHAKMMLIDEDFVTAGSTNFDFRSFENNFECNLLIYSSDVNTHMRKIFFQDLQQSTKVNPAEWSRRPLPQRALESLVRLLSPIL